MLLVLCGAGYAAMQDQKYSEVGNLAQQVITKYERMSCRDLALDRGDLARVDERALKVLRSVPSARRKFINRVATPVASKLFECGLIS